VPSEAPVLMMHTAAVAGRPKGALLTHRNLITQASQTGEVFGLGPGVTQGLLLPLSHTFGAYLMFVGMVRGATTTVLESFDPAAVVRLIDQGRIEFYAEFAPMGQRILDAAGEAGITLGGKLKMVTGLEVASTMERYLAAGVSFYCLYGQTETAGLVSAGAVTREGIAPNYAGRALNLSRLSLRDEQGAPVEPGEPGELWVRSDCVVLRYWPDESTNRTEDGWLKTGDLLRAEHGGDLFFYGRVAARDLIKPGGLNVYPAEVEQVLLAHPRVQRAFVFGVPDPEWREKVVAVIDVEGETAGVEEDVMEHAARRLASFKRPKVVIVDHEVFASGTPQPEVVRAKYGTA